MLSRVIIRQSKASPQIRQLRKLQARVAKRRAARTTPAPRKDEEQPSAEDFLREALVKPPPGAKAAPEGTGAVRLLLEGCQASRTRRAYRADLEIFAGWLQTDVEGAASCLISAPQVQANALAFAWSESMSHLSSATRNRRLSMLRKLVRVAREAGSVTWELTVPGVRAGSTRDMRGPDLDTVKRMLETTSEDLQGMRDRALVLLAVTLGLRRQEIADLRLKNYDRESRDLSFVGKGGKSALLSVPPKVAESLEAWIVAAGISEEEAPLFHPLLRPGRPLSASGVSFIIGSLGEKVGAVVRSNGLRHAAVTLGLDATGGDVRKVRQLARHSKVETTLKYDDARQDFAGQVSEAIANTLKKETEK